MLGTKEGYMMDLTACHTWKGNAWGSSISKIYQSKGEKGECSSIDGILLS